MLVITKWHRFLLTALCRTLMDKIEISIDVSVFHVCKKSNCPSSAELIFIKVFCLKSWISAFNWANLVDLVHLLCIELKLTDRFKFTSHLDYVTIDVNRKLFLRKVHVPTIHKYLNRESLNKMHTFFIAFQPYQLY